eukprot:1159145-Pelagomonas_calceolata.AAC.7
MRAAKGECVGLESRGKKGFQAQQLHSLCITVCTLMVLILMLTTFTRPLLCVTRTTFSTLSPGPHAFLSTESASWCVRAHAGAWKGLMKTWGIYNFPPPPPPPAYV